MKVISDAAQSSFDEVSVNLYINV